MSADILQICIPHTGHDYYDYAANGLKPVIGARVWVNFCRKRCVGVVLAYVETSPFQEKLKPILEVIDTHPLLPPSLFNF